MPTRRQLRSEKKLKNLKKQREKYPELLRKIIDSSDIILEVLDARFIPETRNSEVEAEIKERKKKIIYVLNKSDLIRRNKIKKSELKKIEPYVFVSCKERKGSRELRDKIKIVSKKIEKPIDEKLKKITVGVIGYPNTGKSSVINFLIGKSSAGIGADAGFTKGLQKLKLDSNIILIDSPGVIPKEEYSSSDIEAMVRNTKVGGRSYSQVKEPDVVVARLMSEYKDVLEKRYNIKAEGNSEILIEKLGRKKGFLKKGGNVDEDRTSRFILAEWQSGKIRL
jgi:hypothetical protein